MNGLRNKLKSYHKAALRLNASFLAGAGAATGMDDGPLFLMGLH